MRRYILKRLLQLIPVLLGVTFLSFAMMRLAGSDAITELYGDKGAVSQEIIDAKRAELGLDRPFLSQYFSWLGGLLTGDMGTSYVSGRDVFGTFVSKLPATLLLTALSVAATVLLFSEKELASKWGVDILEEGGLIERTAEEERVGTRVAELAATYRLSPREQEVLALLAEGKTGRVIQQELFIAEGTFKAHTRHIYEKMGINSRKELFELLGVSS